MKTKNRPTLLTKDLFSTFTSYHNEEGETNCSLASFKKPNDKVVKKSQCCGVSRVYLTFCHGIINKHGKPSDATIVETFHLFLSFIVIIIREIFMRIFFVKILT